MRRRPWRLLLSLYPGLLIGRWEKPWQCHLPFDAHDLRAIGRATAREAFLTHGSVHPASRLSLVLARALGLPAVQSNIMRFEDEITIVIERYDRLRKGHHIQRVHQEDVCQALGIMQTKKYQNEGGPGPLEIVELLRTYSTNREVDIDTFVAALGFNSSRAPTRMRRIIHCYSVGRMCALRPSTMLQSFCLTINSTAARSSSR